MTAITVRPGTPDDAKTAPFEDFLPDHWADGLNRRCVVALDDSGRFLGYCRAKDNEFHPDSRVFVLEVVDDDARGPLSPQEIEDALLRAQIEVSDRPLREKPAADEPERIDLCVRHGGILVQLMPPWKYLVDDRLRDWADAHRRTTDGAFARSAGWEHRDEMLDLYVEHYTAQHARWSPAAEPAALRAENAPDFEPGGEESYDPRRSMVLKRNGRIVAQALAWPPQPDGSREIGLQSRPHEGLSARDDMEACLAAAIDAAEDGEVLLIDSHVTEVLESQMARDLRTSGVQVSGEWGAIIGIPVGAGPAPIPLPEEVIPDEAQEFARRFRP